MATEIEMLSQFLREQTAAADPDASIEDRRKAYADIGGAMPLADGVAEEPAQLGGVPGLKFTPDDAQAGAVLYFHGGGYVIGSPVSHRALTSHIAKAARRTVWSMDYRMAPEAPFPAAVDDGVEVYRALLATGLAAKSVVIAGDSAGGGLTVATALKIRDDGLPMPAALCPISPWVNLANEGWSYGEKADADLMVTKDGLDGMAAAYLAGAPATAPLASPALANLTGLPPMFVQVGAEEVLLSDSVALAERAGAAGVPVTLEIWPEMPHVFHFFHAFLTDARTGIARLGDWIQVQTV
ncbi:MAG: alpha/beta hydrolase [Pseudomonadota bacterium]